MLLARIIQRSNHCFSSMHAQLCKSESSLLQSFSPLTAWDDVIDRTSDLCRDSTIA